MAKNRQKSAKIIRKIDFPHNNFPKKAISLRKCAKKYIFAFGEKKSQFFFSRLRRETVLSTPGGGVLYKFCHDATFAAALIPKPVMMVMMMVMMVMVVG